MEICNGKIMRAIPLDHFSVYLRAVNYDGNGRAFSSAIWSEPSPPPLPDLVVDTASCRLRGRKLTLAVRNRGRAAAGGVVVEAWAGSPWKDGTRLARHVFAEVGVAATQRVVLQLERKPDGPLFLRVDPDSYALDKNDDTIAELDERNNCALLPTKGK